MIRCTIPTCTPSILVSAQLTLLVGFKVLPDTIAVQEAPEYAYPSTSAQLSGNVADRREPSVKLIATSPHHPELRHPRHLKTKHSDDLFRIKVEIVDGIITRTLSQAQSRPRTQPLQGEVKLPRIYLTVNILDNNNSIIYL
ncbi:hypothetical protein CRV24_007555 [Beauveria bassiana]|nr:hypothetical protein CRV24_007555 [Beauveria bassiana]